MLDARRTTLLMFGLIAAIVFVRVPPLTLSGTDAACYARIAADLASRPLTSWLDVRWDDGPFYEHPPLALWIEGAWFSIFGATAAAGVWLARLYACLLAFFVWRGARLVTNEATASLCLFGLATLASFQRESQNPMLELPLAVACAAALGEATRLRISSRAALTFALAATAAVWIKGIVALSLGVGLIWALWTKAPRNRVLAAGGLWFGLVIVSALMFEGIRAAAGLTPYFAPYFSDHVLRAFAEGRHNVTPDPLFHVKTLGKWFVPVIVALPLAAWGWRKGDAAWRQLAVLGFGFVVAVLVPFSIAKQKSEWHLNVILPGAAWAVGAGLATLPLQLRRLAGIAAILFAMAWCGWEFAIGTSRDTQRQVAIRTITTTPLRLDGVSVRNCSVLDPWPARHLFAFHWKAHVVGCEESAEWVFDGRSLSRGR